MNSAVSILIYSVPAILVLAFGGMEVIQGTMTIGTLTAFMGYIGVFYSPVHQISGFWSNYKSSQASYDRISEILALANDDCDKSKLLVTRGEIEFERVHFSNNDRIILNDFNTTFTMGRNYLMGDNGSGKTTIARLLCGLYTPDRGKILIDGQDISDVSRNSLRSSVSVVFSDSLLFDGTIADNILFGDLSATKEEMVLAAKKAELHEFVMRLPAQYDTNVGESGLNLSSGEMQKIALARVILRNSPIIIFDEFTRSIDIESKKSIFSVINQLNDKTIIIITHDMNDIEKDGRIVEIGRVGTQPPQDPLIIPSVPKPRALPLG
jgi:ABC-type bacteriocin/lantibiotic exporter with double-glycine peptidase domain